MIRALMVDIKISCDFSDKDFEISNSQININSWKLIFCNIENVIRIQATNQQNILTFDWHYVQLLPPLTYTDFRSLFPVQKL